MENSNSITSQASLRKRKLKCRSPLGVLSLNQVHYGGRGGDRFVGKSPDDASKKKKLLRTSSSTPQDTRSRVENKEGTYDSSLGPQRRAFENRPSEDGEAINDENVVPAGQQRSPFRSPESSVVNYSMTSGETVSDCENQNHVAKRSSSRNVDQFVTSRRRRGNYAPSPDTATNTTRGEDDLATTFSTIEETEGHNDDVDMILDDNTSASVGIGRDSSPVEAERQRRDGDARTVRDHDDDAVGTSTSCDYFVDAAKDISNDDTATTTSYYSFTSSVLTEDPVTKLDPPPPFEYPTNIPPPSSTIVKHFYDLKVDEAGSNDKTPTHQLQLSWSKSRLLSLEDVIIPAVCQTEMNVLKKSLAVAKRDQKEMFRNIECIYGIDDVRGCYPYLTNVDLIEECRETLNQCALAAVTAVSESRIERETNVKSRRKERRLQKKAERKRLYEEKKQEMLNARAIAKEKRRRELKKNLPKNKENWREVAQLMTELARLQKYQQVWKDAENWLSKKEVEIKNKLGPSKEAQTAHSEIENTATISLENDDLAKGVLHDIQKITLSIDRINQEMEGLSNIAQATDEVQRKLFEKYTDEGHQFAGYKGVKKPARLIQMLTAPES